MLCISYLNCILSDYINQGVRFEVQEGFGCTGGTSGGGIDILLLKSWSIVLPLVSALFYFRKSSKPRGFI
jgi:hypothetical protein